MKIFIDTEFHEMVVRPIHIYKHKTIDLISLGMVKENGDSLYLIARDFDLEAAIENDWLKQNVLKPMFREMCVTGDKIWQRPGWIDEFNEKNFEFLLNVHGTKKKDFPKKILEFIGDDEPEFWAYFADYDWVSFCWLFGRMIDLPKGFPFYCLDLKQLMYHNGLTKEWKQEHCPDPENEHNALADAQWNLKLYKTIIEYFNPKIT